jgi:hypothetical protein
MASTTVVTDDCGTRFSALGSIYWQRGSSLLGWEPNSVIYLLLLHTIWPLFDKFLSFLYILACLQQTLKYVCSFSHHSSAGFFMIRVLCILSNNYTLLGVFVINPGVQFSPRIFSPERYMSQYSLPNGPILKK